MSSEKRQLIILIGNIGSGKSTLCKDYSAKGFHIVCRDTLRSMIGGPNGYVFSPATEEAIDAACIRLIETLLSQKEKSIVIDETNMTRKNRKRYIRFAKWAGYEVVAHETITFTKAECLANREKDTLRGYELSTWAEVWEKFNKSYQEPTFEEGFDMLIKEDTKR